MTLYDFNNKLNAAISTAKTIFNKSISILLIISLSIAIFSFMSGFKILYIATGSMEDYINKGQLILVKAVSDDEELIPGNVYTYLPKDRNYTVTHRLIRETDSGRFVFKGDNNQSEDPETVDKCDILYKLILK